MSPAEDIPFEDGDYLIVYQKCKDIINEVFGQTCLTLLMAYINNKYDRWQGYSII
jgi:hypothetical protein